MRRTVTLTLTDPPRAGALLLAPEPFGHWDQVFEGLEVDGCRAPHPVPAANARQRGFVLPGDARVLRYRVRLAPAAAPGWVWQVADNRHTLADPGLAALAAGLAGAGADDAARFAALAAHAAEMFDYDHPEDRFTDGHDAVPALCGTTRGSCTDINTFLLAAARSQGLRVQYIAGFWFGPGRVETPDMHCWLAVATPSGPQFWDVAHHLKWGIAPLGPGLDPAGGRRVAMAYGRGLVFDTLHGRVEVDRLGEPVHILPGGALAEPRLKIHLEESEQ